MAKRRRITGPNRTLDAEGAAPSSFDFDDLELLHTGAPPPGSPRRWAPHDDAPLDVDATALAIGPLFQLAVLTVRHALKGQPGFLPASFTGGTVTLVHLPEEEQWSGTVSLAWTLMVDELAARTSGKRVTVASALWKQAAAARAPVAPDPQLLQRRVGIALLHDDLGRDKRKSTVEFEVALKMGKAIHALSRDPLRGQPPLIPVIAARRIRIPSLRPVFLVRLAILLTEDASLLKERAAVRDHLAGLRGFEDLITQGHLLAARAAGQSAHDYLLRLRDILHRTAPERGRPPAERSSFRLENLHGLGEARAWGDALVADLLAYRRGRLSWADVDRGIVLEGAPGCGKTLFAQALANSAGVPLIAASYAQWQATRDGHLGDTLAAMRRCFAEAKAVAPAVLLIDEIDSLPNRSRLHPKDREYMVAVVNGLLEQLDGALERQGVVVVGACNNAANLDPALTRPGRLEQVVTIPRPDVQSLAAILRIHLRGDLAGLELSDVAKAAAAKGAVGADIERWCRNARRRARMAGRPMILADLQEEVGPAAPSMTDTQLFRCAVHEVGHALAHEAIGPGFLQVLQVGRDGRRGGSASLDPEALHEHMRFLTPSALRSRVVALLAGRAAEIEILGEASHGAGGSTESDLGAATYMVTVAFGSLGLGETTDTLRYRGEADAFLCPSAANGDPELCRQVEGFLSSCHDEARRLMRQNRDVLPRLAEELARRGRLEAAEFRALRVAFEREKGAAENARA